MIQFLFTVFIFILFDFYVSIYLYVLCISYNFDEFIYEVFDLLIDFNARVLSLFSIEKQLWHKFLYNHKARQFKKQKFTSNKGLWGSVFTKFYSILISRSKQQQR